MSDERLTASATALETVLEKYRLTLTRAMALLILAMLLFTASMWSLSPVSVWILDSIALVLLLAACLGRVWCTMYIGGQKNKSIVSAGPYSIVRNPLYLFSFSGALGIALMTHSIVISGLLLVFYLGVYPLVVAKEEANLHPLFGDDYQAYCNKTPRFIPKLKLYSTKSSIPVDANRLERSLFDSGCFVLAFIALSGIRTVHNLGIIPVLFELP